MFLDFEKWHGCRNDFIITWVSDQDGDLVKDSLKRQASKLCDRRGSIGADGLLILHIKSRQDLNPYKLTIINSDGSVANNCGNGLRCAAMSIRKKHFDFGNPDELPEAVELEVEGDIKVCRFMTQDTLFPLVAVEMGVPQLGSAVAWEHNAKNAVKKIAQDTGTTQLIEEVNVCNIGNPHIVITSSHASRNLLLQLGPALQKASSWDGINVHLVKPEDLTNSDQARAGQELGQKLAELHTAYVWERGAGETPACGSGVCAIAASIIDTGLVERDAWIGVRMPGGLLYAQWPSADSPALLAGPAALAFIGRIEV